MTPDLSPLQRAEIELRELRAELATTRIRCQQLEQKFEAARVLYGHVHQTMVQQRTHAEAADARIASLTGELHYLRDLPLCRQQVFNAGVPENTEQALHMWHRAAHNQANRADKAEAELTTLRTRLQQLEDREASADK